MSGSGHVCRCKPWRMKQIGTKITRQVPWTWRVVYRECHHSRFGGGHYRPSRFSSLLCVECRAQWRSKQSYVERVRDVKEGEWP